MHWIAAPRASLRSTTLLPQVEWPILEWLPLGQYFCPSPVRRIWQLWIGRYTHIPAVALVTARFRCYSRAASVGGMFSRRHYFWANSCFLASMTLLRLLVLLCVSKTKKLYHSHRLFSNMIGCILVLHMLQWICVYVPGYPCCVISYACKWRLCVANCKRVDRGRVPAILYGLQREMHTSTKRYPLLIKFYFV